MFREKHIGLSKSLVSSKVAEHMNQDYKNKIKSYIEFAMPDTEDIFTNEFIKE